MRPKYIGQCCVIVITSREGKCWQLQRFLVVDFEIPDSGAVLAKGKDSEV